MTNMPQFSNSDSITDNKCTLSDTEDLDTSVAGRIGTFASLRIFNLRLLLSGTTLSYAAQWIQQVTLSWLIYDITGSGTMLGSINMVRSVSLLGMIPIAGVMIDRFSRRNLLLITNGWLFVITLALGILLISGHSHIFYLFAFAFLAGVAQTVDMTLRQVLVFDLVPRAYAPNALALISTGWSLMRSFGPAIGGLLILWFGAGGNFLIQAVAYALIAITISQIHYPSRKVSKDHSSPLQNIREGLQYLAKERVTRNFMLMGFILPLFIIPIISILPPVYAQDVFHGGPEVLGFLLSAIGIGGIIGGIVTASLGRLERRGLLQIASLFLLSLSLIGFAFTTKLVFALPFLVLAGFFEVIFLITNQTLLQLSIPDNIRGRITSILNLQVVLALIGGLVAGIGSDLFGGPRWITIILCCMAMVIGVGVLLGSSTIRNYRLSQAIKPGLSETSGNSKSS